MEYIIIGSIAEIGTGTSNRQDAVKDGKYPFYVRSKEVQRINTFEFDEEAIIIPGEGGIGDIFHYVNGKYALHQRAYRIHFLSNTIITRFAYYYLISAFKNYIHMKAVNATVTSIRKPMIEQFPIPIPPIEVQNEIVRILDKFTELEAELEAELDCRKKQYQYYRDKLLSFDKIAMGGGKIEEVKWVRMGEICMIKGRIGFRGYTRQDLVEESEGAISLSPSNIIDGVLTFDKCSYISWTKYYESPEIMAEVGDIIFTKTASVGKTALIKYLPKETTINPQIVLLKNISCNPYFLSYVLKTTKIQNEVKKITGVGSVPNVPQSALANILIPIPPLEEQHRIVSILDRFEALTTDICNGLPAEIKARRQQYEYYRDKLLTFKQKTA